MKTIVENINKDYPVIDVLVNLASDTTEKLWWLAEDLAGLA